MQTSRIAALLNALQGEILGMIAYGDPVARIADLICRRVGETQNGVICSILGVDPEGRLRPLAAPFLPRAYSRALDGLPIGPNVGSCGTAAFRGEPVEVHDIETDPLWDDYRHLALPPGLKACWSSPIKARDGNVVGTFAFYYDTRRGPDSFDREIVAHCTQLCAIAIEHQQLFAQLHKVAYLDALTKLPNRASFNLRLNQLTRLDRPFGLLVADLDHVKSTNDMLGHEAGDALIRAVSRRLLEFGADMEAYRLGGDEFGLILRNCASGVDLARMADELIRNMEIPVQHLEHAIPAYVTVGGALFEPGAMDADTLLQNADFALYHGKATNRGGFAAFHQGMRTSITHRMAVITRVGDALAAGRVYPYYQPIVRIDTGEIIGLEALARIEETDGSLHAAGEFEEAFSDPRLAYAITGRMLEQVALDVRHWLDLGIAYQHVGFNVTTADFQRGDLVTRLGEAFAAAGVPLKHFILEVNEAVFMGSGDSFVAEAVSELRRQGLRVALDDFGTGYASMTHLLDFPVDIVKIDKSFVSRLMNDERSAIIVESLIAMSGKLDMRVVAEGVETEEQAERLLAMGCRLGQGFYYSRPVTAADASELLMSFAQGRDGKSLKTRRTDA
ncbi:EAL domain-containing protein [Mesorhizobium sp. CAU 1732]|uniref:putative bifunctional diguanylate cyclase/phosphodiesterase n=1 Tax=Mesorhizobium sp. CAU 1732 TaxID=3140358 RepID=UPI0032601CB3